MLIMLIENNLVAIMLSTECICGCTLAIERLGCPESSVIMLIMSIELLVGGFSHFWTLSVVSGNVNKISQKSQIVQNQKLF